MERIDDLMRGGLRLIQDPDRFCFGTDAVLLSDFAKASAREKVLDLCAGNGVVSLLMLARYPSASYTALEIQPELADLARRSVELNHVEDKVSVIEGDLKEIRTRIRPGSFDVVTVNPPYMAGQGLQNESESVRLARHEVACTLHDVVEAAAYALKYHGRFYMVHRPERLAEIMTELTLAKLEPKMLRLIQPFEGKEPTQLLVMASLGGGKGMRVLPPLITYRAPGVYTEEMLAVYGDDGHVHNKPEPDRLS